MELETRKENEIIYIKPLVKRIDASSSTVFKAQITDFIVQGEMLIVLNLGSVEFIDSSGLGALISILKTVSNSKGNIALCDVNPNVLNLFAITRINSILSISPDESGAKKRMLEWIDNLNHKETIIKP